MRNQRKAFTQETDMLLQVLNKQRHDWMNHFQVLLGYLKLDRPEDVGKYLKKVTEETHQESTIARMNCSLLSVYFLTFHALHNDIKLEAEAASDVNLARLEMRREDFFVYVVDFVDTLRVHLTHTEMEEPSLLISLGTKEGAIQIRFDLIGELAESVGTEVEKLISRGKQSGARVTEFIHTNEEWVLEMSFPCTK